MERCFIFCHGFASFHEYWDHIAPLFKKEVCFFLDLGYFGEEYLFPKNHPTNITYIGVGHSLGMAKLLDLDIPFTHLIGLQSFLSFQGFAPEMRKKRRRQLTATIKRFTAAPKDMLGNFYDTAGMPVPGVKWKKINLMRLTKDLLSLRKAFTLPQATKTLILGTKDDSVVPPELLHDNFDHLHNVTLDIMEKGQHGLGFLEADLVYSKIMAFVGQRNPQNT